MTGDRRTPHIAYIVDHPDRDMPGAIMFAHAAARSGVRTSLVPLYNQGIDVPLLAPDALVTTFARPANRGLVESYKKAGIAVWVLDTEGGVLADDGPNTPHRFARYVEESGFSSLLEGYMFWGEELHRAFVNGTSMGEDRLAVTGCPRFDWAAPRWRDLLSFDMSGYILVNMNFPLVNSRFNAEGVDRDAMEKAGWKSDYVDLIIGDSRLIQSRMIETVARLARDFPARKFLVRPHPFERIDIYADAFKQLPNVTVRGDGSVLNVIRNSLAILHMNCGTAIEGVLLDRMSISLDYLSTASMRTHSSLPSRVSVLADSYEMLARIVGDVEAEGRAFDFAGVFKSFIEPYFYLNDGFAAERAIAAVCNRLPRDPRRASYASAFRSSQPRPTLAQRARALFGNVAGTRALSLAQARVQRHRKAKHFEPKQVQETLDTLSGHLNEPKLVARSHRHPISRARLSSIEVYAV